MKKQRRMITFGNGSVMVSWISLMKVITVMQLMASAGVWGRSQLLVRVFLNKSRDMFKSLCLMYCTLKS